MTTIPDVECLNSPKRIGIRELEFPYEFDWSNQGTPSAVVSVTAYDGNGTEVADAVGGAPVVTGDNVDGFTVDGSKFTPPGEYFLVCIVTMGGSDRGTFCRLISTSFP